MIEDAFSVACLARKLIEPVVMTDEGSDIAFGSRLMLDGGYPNLAMTSYSFASVL